MFDNDRKPEKGREIAYKCFVGIRLGTAQTVIDMQDSQVHGQRRRERVENVEQRYGISSSRNRNADAASAGHHAITSDDFRDSIRNADTSILSRAFSRRFMRINPPLTATELQKLAAGIELLLMDVDGVLTDGRLFLVPGPDGKMVETKGFDSQDGIALRWLSWYGIKTGVISGRESPATQERARQVGMSYVYQGHIEKIPIYEQIVADAQISPSQVAYMGDDLTDVVIMRRVGLAIAPQNAPEEVKRSAHVVTSARGGRGAVREVIETLLKARRVWDQLLRKYEVLPAEPTQR